MTFFVAGSQEADCSIKFQASRASMGIVSITLSPFYNKLVLEVFNDLNVRLNQQRVAPHDCVGRERDIFSFAPTRWARSRWSYIRSDI